jgi:hypothetical protein
MVNGKKGKFDSKSNQKTSLVLFRVSIVDRSTVPVCRFCLSAVDEAAGNALIIWLSTWALTGGVDEDISRDGVVVSRPPPLSDVSMVADCAD